MRELKTLNNLFLLKVEKRNYILLIKMFDEILLIFLDQKEDYLKLKKEVVQTPLEKSIDDIIERINLNLDKITRLNQIGIIY
jgi:hypothetical protein